MTSLLRTAAAVLVAAWAVTGAAPRLNATQADEPGGTAALVEFSRRVQVYVELHRRLEGPVPTNTVSSDPREIRAAMDRLAAKIQRERRTARQGDVFTPEIAPVFRRLILQGCQGDLKGLLDIVQEETAPGIALPGVNGRWPLGAAHSMVPSRLLCGLPPLPEEMQYRFIGPHLLLWDMHADVIVDLLPNAIST